MVDQELKYIQLLSEDDLIVYQLQLEQIQLIQELKRDLDNLFLRLIKALSSDNIIV